LSSFQKTIEFAILRTGLELGGCLFLLFFPLRTCLVADAFADRLAMQLELSFCDLLMKLLRLDDPLECFLKRLTAKLHRVDRDLCDHVVRAQPFRQPRVIEVGVRVHELDRWPSGRYELMDPLHRRIDEIAVGLCEVLTFIVDERYARIDDHRVSAGRGQHAASG
jgi:hypothetical protein